MRRPLHQSANNEDWQQGVREEGTAQRHLGARVRDMTGSGLKKEEASGMTTDHFVAPQHPARHPPRSETSKWLNNKGINELTYVTLFPTRPKG